jgi:hypothetical protein
VRLAIIGVDGKAMRDAVRHGKKTGYTVTSHAHGAPLKRTDAVLCLLHEGHRLLDERAHSAVTHVVDAMKAARAKRLVLFALVADHHEKTKRRSFFSRVKSFFKREAKTAIDVLKQSGLDWTVICWPEARQHELPDGLGKYMVNQLTDVANLRRVFVHPDGSEEA